MWGRTSHANMSFWVTFRITLLPLLLTCCANTVECIILMQLNEEETSLFDVLWLLLASVVFVPIFQKIPGGIHILTYLYVRSINSSSSNFLMMVSFIWLLRFELFTGSPVLGYLAAGVLIGPYALSIIWNVHGTKAIAEFGVVFLLFNIGLEVSMGFNTSISTFICWVEICSSRFVQSSQVWTSGSV